MNSTRLDQPVLPLLPADARPVGPIAGLVEDGDGSTVFVCGLATFAFAAGDETGRRLAAVQLVEAKIASVAAVTAAFDVTQATLWRWRAAFATDGVAGLMPVPKGPKGPSKLTDDLAEQVRAFDGRGLSLAKIGARCGVSTATVRVALGRVAHRGIEIIDAATTVDDADAVDGGEVLPVLSVPPPRTVERQLARTGLFEEVPVEFTAGAHLPLAGLLLIMPAVGSTGLLQSFVQVFGRLKNGFYGLRSTVLTMLFMALLRDPRAEGATRIRPADLGRVLGLDRAPEVKTLRRKLAEMAAHGRGAEVQAAIASAHAATHPDMLGFLHVDGHTRVYSGKRDLPKTHVARLNMIARATAETWISDAVADPVMVVTGEPGASLAGELIRLIPDMRAFIDDGRRATVIFDRGGWSAKTFAALIDAGLDILTYRKGNFTELPEAAFVERSFTDPAGVRHDYHLAETTVVLPLGDRTGGTVSLRQIHKRTEAGTQIPILASKADLDPAEACWRLSARWRQENFFRYQREHFALDALDSYADMPDDGSRPVPNPAKKKAGAAIDAARAETIAAHADLSAAIDDATRRAGLAENHGQAVVDPAAGLALQAAQDRLDQAATIRRQTPSHLPLRDVRPGARLLSEERKLITHAIRMAAYNAESTLARMLAPHYARAEHEGRALLREAFTLAGDIWTEPGRLHVRLDPATAPRRSRALAALCRELTDTETTYPGTDLKVIYSIKNQP